MTWKTYALMSGGTLLATWLASGGAAPERAAPAAAALERPRADAALRLREEAARLETSLRQERAYRAPVRNPFRFAEPAAAPPAAAPDAAIAPAASAEPRPELPFLVLSGIASDVRDGVVERTAILTTAAGVLLVSEGDPVGDEYRVRAVYEDAIELESRTDGTIRRLEFPVPFTP